MRTQSSEKTKYLQQQQRVTKIDIRPLKELVLEKFPPDNQLRIVLLAERDVLEAHEFLAKLETWFILLRGRS